VADRPKPGRSKARPAAGEHADGKKLNGRRLLTEENYRTIFDNSAVAITVTDEDENIVFWNKCAEALLRMDGDDLYMRPVRSLYPEEEWHAAPHGD
jgi:PAS domain-containing protein